MTRKVVSCVIFDMDEALVNTGSQTFFFLKQTDLLFSWCKIKAQPGVYRLIEHLRGHGAKITLASNSTRANIETKLSFLLCCYNFRTGVCAAKAAEMEVVAVPSLSRPHIYTAACEMISSFLDLQLETWGLPPSEDGKLFSLIYSYSCKLTFMSLGCFTSLMKISFGEELHLVIVGYIRPEACFICF
ncbi:hypothetical protein R6Q59_005054 [Mikania micrantha]